MKVVARRRQGYAHEVKIEGGHTVVIDEPAEAGGTDTGPSPTRLLAASLAACTAITMEMYAGRKGWDLGGIEVDVDVDYEDFTPRSFEVTLRLPAGLDDEKKARLRTIAAKCPVHKVLTGSAQVDIAERIEVL
jgi:putative redox protein